MRDRAQLLRRLADAQPLAGVEIAARQAGVADHDGELVVEVVCESRGHGGDGVAVAHPRRVLRIAVAHPQLGILQTAPKIIAADTLFGRHWGAIEHHPCLHFETAYYQPLTYCIEHGIRTFEGGAQGEHKMARGFLPQQTWSETIAG